MPKRLSAKPTKIAVRRRFTHGLPASIVTPAAPTSTASARPSAVKLAMMPNPKTSAWRIDVRRSVAAWLVKYDTVIGTIGKTHGVSSDSAPADAASQMKASVMRRSSGRRFGRARDGHRDEHRLGVGRETERRVAGLKACLDRECVRAGPRIGPHAHDQREGREIIVRLDVDAEVRVKACLGGGAADRSDQLERLARCERDTGGNRAPRSLADRVDVPSLIDPSLE